MKYICGMLLALLVTNAQADWCHDLGTIYTKSVYYYNKKITIDRVYDNVLSTYQGSDEARHSRRIPYHLLSTGLYP